LQSGFSRCADDRLRAPVRDYKRATLLFNDPEWLRAIISDPERPVLFIFTGRAHTRPMAPGQELVRRISDLARSRDFEGRVLLVEGYDLRLARRLLLGVDVWLNTPVYPLEASGTSGMKGGMNGVINLSVLDGWWAKAIAATTAGRSSLSGTRKIPSGAIARKRARSTRFCRTKVVPALLSARRQRHADTMDSHGKAIDRDDSAAIQRGPHGR
jgi:alpha-glucan phosphorylase-like protein